MNIEPKLYNQSNRLQRKDAQLIFDKLKNVYQQRISLLLDVGSGTGNLTKELRQYIDCEKIVGIDVSKVMTEYAQDNYGSENIVFTYGDICEPLEQLTLHLNKPAGTFDVVTSIYCLHWVSNQKTALNNISSMLKPGGKCFLLFFFWSNILPIQEQITRHPRWIHCFEKVLKKEPNLDKLIVSEQSGQKVAKGEEEVNEELNNKHDNLDLKPSAPFQALKTPSVENRIQYWKDLCAGVGLIEAEVTMHDSYFTFEDFSYFKDEITSLCHYVQYIEPGQREEFLKDYFEHMKKFYISLQKNLPQVKMEYQFLTIYAKKNPKSSNKEEYKTKL